MTLKREKSKQWKLDREYFNFPPLFTFSGLQRTKKKKMNLKKTCQLKEKVSSAEWHALLIILHKIFPYFHLSLVIFFTILVILFHPHHNPTALPCLHWPELEQKKVYLVCKQFWKPSIYSRSTSTQTTKVSGKKNTRADVISARKHLA